VRDVGDKSEKCDSGEMADGEEAEGDWGRATKKTEKTDKTEKTGKTQNEQPSWIPPPLPRTLPPSDGESEGGKKKSRDSKLDSAGAGRRGLNAVQVLTKPLCYLNLYAN
jgi:hypothetical protein